MDFTAVDPYVRRVMQFNGIDPMVRKCSYDHRLMFVQEGECLLELDGKTVRCEKNMLCYWQPGQWYCYRQPAGPVTLISLFFDFDRTREGEDIPLYTPTREVFRSEWVGQPVEISGQPMFGRSFVLENFSEGSQRIREMLRDYNLHMIGYRQRLNANLMILLTDLHRRFLTERGGGASRRAAVDRVTAYIHDHLDKPLTGAALSEIFHYHPNSLNRMIADATGLSLHRYIQGVRIRRAVEMLETTGLSVAEIGCALGFSDSSHFIKVFRRETGDTPARLRSSGRDNLHRRE